MDKELFKGVTVKHAAIAGGALLLAGGLWWYNCSCCTGGKCEKTSKDNRIDIVQGTVASQTTEGQAAPVRQQPTTVHDPSVLLHGDEVEHRVQVSLVSKKRINHDSFIMTFGFDPEKTLGVPICNHFRIYMQKDGEEKRHTYTPLSLITTKGHLEVLVKVYYPNIDYPEGGYMTQQLDKLNEGDRITIAGPAGKLIYHGNGEFSTKDGQRTTYSKITYLCGGSGITPFLSIMRHIVLNPDDKVQVTLINSNHTEEDILMKDELQHWADSGRLKLVNTVTKQQTPAAMGVCKGHITSEMVGSNIPAPSADHAVFYCGPSGFNKTAQRILEQLGHSEDNIIKL